MSEFVSPMLRNGIDLVSVVRLRSIMERTPAFAEKVFTEGEVAYCDKQAYPHIHFAARFAAKEAAIKALGLGLAEIGIDRVLKEIEVVRDHGPPRLVLHGRAAERARRLEILETTLSLTHTDEHAMASVVMLGRTNGHDRDPDDTHQNGTESS